MDEKSKEVVISLNTASLFKALLVIIFFGALFVLRDLVLVVLTSVLIASAIEPATKWFGRNRIPRAPAVLFIFLGSALLLILLFYFLFVPLLAETVDFIRALPEHLVILEAWNPFQEGFLGQTSTQDLSGEFSLQRFIDQTNLALAGTFNFLGTISVVFGGALSLVLIIILSFYLSVQENGVAKFLKLVTPLKHENYVLNLWKRAETKIGLWMQGQIVLAVIIGVLTYLGLVLLDIPNALLLAFLAALLELIPLFGPFIAAVPAVISGFVEGGITLALIVAGFYLIIQQFESHLIYPLVVRKVVGLSPIVVILALISGFRLAGFLGLLLSVPLATVALIFFEDMEQKKHRQSQQSLSSNA
jgi:predicted PurR-regulated permease PerM